MPSKYVVAMSKHKWSAVVINKIMPGMKKTRLLFKSGVRVSFHKE